jgi:hypothetical protein
MKNIASVLAVAAAIATGGIANVNAQSSHSFSGGSAHGSAPASDVPNTAFFVGLGGSYNSVGFRNQNIFAQGISNIFLNGALVASGSAGGPADPYSTTQSTFAPAAQVGYFQHFAGSNWLWGAKFSYSYVGATSTNQSVIVPQVGSFTSANSDTFTGNVVVRSYDTGISHQMAFMPLIGRSFEKSFVYFGAGPTVSQTQSHLNGVIGFAAINGTHVNITGTPSNFSSSPWVYGGAATVGATYFFDRSWFLDASYTFGMTKVQTSYFAAPFASATDGYTDTGILSGHYSGKAVTQSFTMSINKAFDFRQ